MESTTLSVRKTNKYVGTWAHLDEWEDIGTAEIIERNAEVQDHEDPCEPTLIQMLLRVTTNEPKDNEAVKLAIMDTFSRHGCSHEYDCCGCWSTTVTNVHSMGGGFFLVTQTASRNY